MGGEAEESSDLEQHLGEGLSPASCTERNAAQRPLVPVTPTGTTIQTSDLRFAILKLQPERVPEEVRKRASGDRGAWVPCDCERARLYRTHGYRHAGLSESLDRCGAVLNPRCNASKIKRFSATTTNGVEALTEEQSLGLTHAKLRGSLRDAA